MKNEIIKEIEIERNMIDGCLNVLQRTDDELEVYKQVTNINFYMNRILKLKIKFMEVQNENN